MHEQLLVAWSCVFLIFVLRWALSIMQSAAVSDPEESKDSSTRNLYAAHIVRQGLNKEGWKLVVTGASTTVFMVSIRMLHLPSAVMGIV